MTLAISPSASKPFSLVFAIAPIRLFSLKKNPLPSSCLGVSGGDSCLRFSSAYVPYRCTALYPPRVPFAISVRTLSFTASPLGAVDVFASACFFSSCCSLSTFFAPSFPFFPPYSFSYSFGANRASTLKRC